MNISRKEFLLRGIFAFGREVVAGISDRGDVLSDKCAGQLQGALIFYEEHCLAQRGGCFACLDHCPQEAITIQPGVGIHVDGAKCDGCGECIEFCPVQPKAIMLDYSQVA